jgi:TM2 domain-containing membrane protein YozV
LSLDIAALERMKAGLSENERMQLDMEIRAARKDSGTLMAVACLGFIGIAGVHRFMMGKVGTGILWLLTGGLCWIGTIIDLINMGKTAAEYNYEVEYNTIQEFLIRKGAREGES